MEDKDIATQFGFIRNVIHTENHEIVYYHYKDREDATKIKPLFLYLVGSGPCSIMTNIKGKTGSSIMFDLTELSKHYHFVIVAKPFIPFYTDDTFEAHEEYYKTDDLYFHAQCNSEVIDSLITNRIVDSSKIVVCGVSHGSDVAAQVALSNRNVTHLACIAGNGLVQTYNFITEVRKDYRRNVLTEQEAETQIQYLYAKFKEIYHNPESLQIWWGHTYKYWFSFFMESTLSRLLQLSIPIFFAKGTEDESGCIEGSDIIPVEFLRKDKDNLTYKAYWGMNHMFDSINSNPKQSKLEAVKSDFWDWLERNYSSATDNNEQKK